MNMLLHHNLPDLYEFEERNNDDANNDLEEELDGILCKHCGRSLNNGVRCIGICVSDNDY